jgi:hypothetical protein
MFGHISPYAKLLFHYFILLAVSFRYYIVIPLLYVVGSQTPLLVLTKKGSSSRLQLVLRFSLLLVDVAVSRSAGKHCCFIKFKSFEISQ